MKKVRTKLKSKRGAMKRFKVTGTGKVMANKANRRHILSSKPPKRKRQYRSSLFIEGKDAKNIKKMILSQ